MEFKRFKSIVDLVNRSEIDRIGLLAYFQLKAHQISEFQLKDLREWSVSAGFSNPNPSRLKQNILKSRNFVKGAKNGFFRLSQLGVTKIEKAYPLLLEEDEELEVSNTILPLSLVGNRGYVINLAKQINVSYDHNIYDGTALLMRKLIEVLLIHTYQHLGIEATILHPNDRYKDLSHIIADATSNKTINLSKDTRDCLDDFRELGNFSAHKALYNCRRQEIKNLAREYRAAVEELLYKAGLK